MTKGKKEQTAENIAFSFKNNFQLCKCGMG